MEIDKRDALIVKQLLEIEDLRHRMADIKESAGAITRQIVGMGGPLNDNVKQYTKEQFGDWLRVKNLAEEIEDLAKEQGDGN